MLSKAGLFAYGMAENVDRGTLFPHMTVLEHRRLGRRVARATASQPLRLRCAIVADKHAMLSTARHPTPSCPPGGQLYARAAISACQEPTRFLFLHEQRLQPHLRGERLLFTNAVQQRRAAVAGWQHLRRQRAAALTAWPVVLDVLTGLSSCVTQCTCVVNILHAVRLLSCGVVISISNSNKQKQMPEGLVHLIALKLP